MSTKVVNPIRLRNLTYGDVVQNLSHVTFGSYHLPNPDDTCRTVNNEFSFESWKSKMLFKYPNAEVKFDVKAIWSQRIKIIDRSFQYESEVFVNSKNNILSA